MQTGSTPATSEVMLDTNVLVYGFTPEDVWKQKAAVTLINDLLRQRRLVLSVQVLNEFYAAITRPTRKVPLSPLDALLALRRFGTAGRVLPIDQRTTFLAVEAGLQHGLSFWDALIWAAAKENNISLSYSEDFQGGRDVDGVRFQDPFRVPSNP